MRRRFQSRKHRMDAVVPDPHKHTGSGAPAKTGTGAPAFPDGQSMGLALEAGGVGVWSWDIKTDAVTWMGKLAEIHGINPANWSGTFSTFQQVIHPEDQPEVVAAIKESLRSRKPYHVHYRLAPGDANKEERRIEAGGFPAEDDGRG